VQKSPSTPRRPIKESNEAHAARTAIRESIAAKERVATECLGDIIEMAHMIINALQKGRKIVFFGNGGSAADAQHIVAELVGKFKTVRPPLDAIALTTNTSILTAIGNDFSFDEIFSRQIRANLSEDDVAVGISTSGRSKNVILGVQEARNLGAKTIALTGGDGGQLASLCDLKIIVPSNDTQRIQECHIMIGHIVCELVDEALGSNSQIRERQVQPKRSTLDANS
jgi:D-sedoheptulose 7-phosphate isomerase